MSPQSRSGPVQRWREAPDAEPFHARAAALVREVPAPPELSAARLALLGERIEQGARSGRLPAPAWLKWAVGAGAFAGAPLAFAAVLRLVAGPAVPLSIPPTQAPQPAQAPAARPGAPVESVPAFELGIDLSGLSGPAEASGANPGLAKRATRPATGPRAAAGPSPAPDPVGSTLKDESALLARALSRLRVDQNPQGALEALGEYRRRFPNGVLRDEERVGRIDALLALDRRPEALEELEAIGSSRVLELPRGPDLKVLEAELYAEQGRCDRAMESFDSAMARLSPEEKERAFFGRASCRARLGEPDGAAAKDLRRYLERYPSGRFAAAARALLDRVGGAD